MNTFQFIMPDTSIPTLSPPNIATVQDTMISGDTQSEQILMDAGDLLNDVFANDDNINCEALEDYNTLSNSVEAPRLGFSDSKDDALFRLPQAWESSCLPTISGSINDLDPYSTDVNFESIGYDAYGCLSDIEYGGILSTTLNPSSIVQSPTSYQSQEYILQREQSEQRSHFSSQSDFGSSYTTSSTDYGIGQVPTTPGTASMSSVVRSTSSTVELASLPDLSTRRGRPALSFSLSTHAFPPQSGTSETSSSIGSSDCPAAPPPTPNPASIPVQAPAPDPVPAPKPRRGRPPIYSRTPESSTSPRSLTREQNRLAAQRFRGRREAYMNVVKAEADCLQTINNDLKHKVARLREERLQLRDGMLNHANCGCGVAEMFLEGEMEKMRRDSMDYVDAKGNSYLKRNETKGKETMEATVI